MKSKSYILMQIRDLLKTNRGMCEYDIEEEMNTYQSKKVYELLVIKSELAKYKEFPDVSCMNWFRGEDL